MKQMLHKRVALAAFALFLTVSSCQTVKAACATFWACCGKAVAKEIVVYTMTHITYHDEGFDEQKIHLDTKVAQTLRTSLQNLLEQQPHHLTDLLATCHKHQTYLSKDTLTFLNRIGFSSLSIQSGEEHISLINPDGTIHDTVKKLILGFIQKAPEIRGAHLASITIKTLDELVENKHLTETKMVVPGKNR